MDKQIALSAAVEKIPDGPSLMVVGFMGNGSPHRLIGGHRCDARRSGRSPDHASRAVARRR